MSKRDKTKDELSRLAEILVSKYQIETILGTGDFLETALSEARRSNIQISGQSIRKYEKDIALKCKSLQSQTNYTPTQVVQNSQFGDENDLYTYYGDVSEDSFIIEKAMEIMSRYLNGEKKTTEFTNFTKEVSTPKETIRVPEYTMFAEAEDGLMYIRGMFKGRLVDGKMVTRNGNYPVTEAAYADWVLKEDREGRGNLTQDDAAVLTKIALGQI